MLKYKLVEETENTVSYNYYPDGNSDFGTVTIDRKSGDISNVVLATSDEFKRYLYHMIEQIEEFVESGDFRKEGLIAWY